MSKDEDFERLVTLVLLHALISKEGLVPDLHTQLKRAVIGAQKVMEELKLP